MFSQNTELESVWALGDPSGWRLNIYAGVLGLTNEEKCELDMENIDLNDFESCNMCPELVDHNGLPVYGLKMWDTQEQLSGTTNQFDAICACDQSQMNPFMFDELCASECNTEADTNCNGEVSFDELIVYANWWIQHQITFEQLIQAANVWVNS